MRSTRQPGAHHNGALISKSDKDKYCETPAAPNPQEEAFTLHRADCLSTWSHLGAAPVHCPAAGHTHVLQHLCRLRHTQHVAEQHTFHISTHAALPHPARLQHTSRAAACSNSAAATVVLASRISTRRGIKCCTGESHKRRKSRTLIPCSWEINIHKRPQVAAPHLRVRHLGLLQADDVGGLALQQGCQELGVLRESVHIAVTSRMSACRSQCHSQCYSLCTWKASII